MQGPKASHKTEDLTSYLTDFCKTLDEIGTGKKGYSLQLKDISLFKAIKYKIENYPVINELYSRIDNSKRKRNVYSSQSSLRQTVTGRPMTASSASHQLHFDKSVKQLSATDGFKSFSVSNSAAQLQVHEIETVDKNYVLYTATEIRLFISEATSQVKKLANCLKKFKIAAFSSYSNPSLIQKAVLEQLLPILIGDKLIAVALGDKTGGSFSNTTVVEVKPIQGVDQTELLRLMNEIGREGVRTITVKGHKVLVATLIQGDNRYQFASCDDRDELFE